MRPHHEGGGVRASLHRAGFEYFDFIVLSVKNTGTRLYVNPGSKPIVTRVLTLNPKP